MVAEYIYPHELPGERERLELLAELLDETSQQHLRRSGIGPGWRCIEVGAGTGSLSAWMADHVAPDGVVTATDLQPDFIEAVAGERLRVARFDVVEDDPPESDVDLVVGRAILHHLPQRREVIRRAVEWVKPGGWIYFEEPDVRFAELIEPETQRDLWRHWRSWSTANGMDYTTGGSLAGWMYGEGLEELFVQTTVHTYNGGSRAAELYRTSVMIAAAQLLEHGVDGEQLDEFERLYRDPAYWTAPIGWTAALGRRPH